MSDVPGINPTSDRPTTQVDRLRAITELSLRGPFGPEYAIDPPGVLPPHVIVPGQVADQVEQARYAAVTARIVAECERLGAETAMLNARIAHAEAWSKLVRIEGGRS